MLNQISDLLDKMLGQKWKTAAGLASISIASILWALGKITEEQFYWFAGIGGGLGGIGIGHKAINSMAGK